MDIKPNQSALGNWNPVCADFFQSAENQLRYCYTPSHLRFIMLSLLITHRRFRVAFRVDVLLGLPSLCITYYLDHILHEACTVVLSDCFLTIVYVLIFHPWCNIYTISDIIAFFIILDRSLHIEPQDY